MGAAAQLPLLCLFAGLGFGGLRAPWAWAWASACIWAIPLWRPLPWRAPAPGWWAAWLAWTLLAALVSGEPLRGLAAFSRGATFLAFFLAACGLWTGASRRLWFWLLCGSGCALALAALAVPLPSRPMVGLLFPYKNYTACVQAALFAAGLGAWLSGYPRARAGRALLAAIMALALACLLLAGSRGALLSCAAAAALGLWRRGWRWTLLLLFSALTALFSLLPLSALTPLLKLDQRGAQTRPQLWAAAVAVANDHPLLGQGPGQFERGFLRHNFPVPPGHRPTRWGLRSAHAHSEPLQLAAESGWPALALFLAALALSLLKARARPGDWTREAGLLAFCAIFLQTLGDNLLHLPAMALLYFSALAVATGDGPERPAPPRGWTRSLAASGLLLACLAWWPDWAVGRFQRLARSSAGGERLAWLESALRLAPEDPDLWAELARLRLSSDPPDPEGAFAALAQAARRHPTNAIYLVMQGELLRGRGLWGETLAAAEAALALEPRCLQAELLRVEALRRLGREAQARAVLSAFKARDPRPREKVAGYDAMVLYFDEGRYREILGMLAGPR